MEDVLVIVKGYERYFDSASSRDTYSLYEILERLEELYYEKEELEEQLEDLKRDIEDNYKPIQENYDYELYHQ